MRTQLPIEDNLIVVWPNYKLDSFADTDENAEIEITTTSKAAKLAKILFC